MSDTLIKLKRGLEVNRNSLTPSEGELLLTTDENKLYVGDGSTVGGVEIISSDVDDSVKDLFVRIDGGATPSTIQTIDGHVEITGELTGKTVDELNSNILAMSIALG